MVVRDTAWIGTAWASPVNVAMVISRAIGGTTLVATLEMLTAIMTMLPLKRLVLEEEPGKAILVEAVLISEMTCGVAGEIRMRESSSTETSKIGSTTLLLWAGHRPRISAEDRKIGISVVLHRQPR